MFGESRVIVTFLGGAVDARRPPPPAPPRRAAGRAPGRSAAPAARAAAAPQRPSRLRRAAHAGLRGRRPGAPPPAAAALAVQPRARGAEVEVHDGSQRHGGPDHLPRRGHRAPVTSSIPRAKALSRPGRRDDRTPASLAVGRSAVLVVRLHRDRRRRGEGRLREADRRRARRRKPSPGSTARRPATSSCSAAWLVGMALAYMGLKRRGKTQPELHHRLRRRRRRAGLARIRAVAARTRWSRRPAPTTS